MTDSFRVLKPDNMPAFITIMVGLIIFTISLAFVFYRMPAITLPTSDELDKNNNIKINKPPNSTSVIPPRDPINPFPNFYPATISQSDAYNKSDFNNLYNNHIKPELETQLLNNQFLIIDKKSKTSDLMVSLLCACVGFIVLGFGINIYLKQIKQLTLDINNLKGPTNTMSMSGFM